MRSNNFGAAMAAFAVGRHLPRKATTNSSYFTDRPMAGFRWRRNC